MSSIVRRLPSWRWAVVSAAVAFFLSFSLFTVLPVTTRSGRLRSHPWQPRQSPRAVCAGVRLRRFCYFASLQQFLHCLPVPRLWSVRFLWRHLHRPVSGGICEQPTTESHWAHMRRVPSLPSCAEYEEATASFLQWHQVWALRMPRRRVRAGAK